MSFENLPATWTDHPLTDPTVTADVVDLMVSHGDRRRGTLTAVVCDPDARYRATVIIELPPTVELRRLADPDTRTIPNPNDLCQTALHPIIPAVRTAPGTSLILALGRPGPAHLPAHDQEWSRAAHAICKAADVHLLGFYITTKEGIHQSHPVSDPTAA
ncbi:hypothetical protein [Kribbella shirazensis]|uniref:DUF4192 family protein n=1 Tax=Kribbella shirazensis TaxID=1105143 RepID=A0A7X6A2Z5_9ACTN|nr:hypothetical protein [Kribbella shirazensis]NIK58789.1 hypothetical protein [Kribbella shirazensis]